LAAEAAGAARVAAEEDHAVGAAVVDHGAKPAAIYSRSTGAGGSQAPVTDPARAVVTKDEVMTISDGLTRTPRHRLVFLSARGHKRLRGG
jgi:hypothetical protein